MALSDLSVFSEYAYSSATEVLRQQVELFNGASVGTIILRSAAHEGDYSDSAFYAKISGLVRRRNAYGSGSIASKNLQHLVDTMVKIAAGTAEVSIDPGQFTWIQRNPEEAGAVIGQQMAKEMLADMLNVSVSATRAALSQVSAVINDVTGDTTKTATFRALNRTTAKFGDSMNEIAAWVIHSIPMSDLYDNALNNGERLFNYGTVNVMRDPFGRLFIMSDSPGLVDVTATPDEYYTIGLVPGAVMVGQNNDFNDNIDTKNGDENIQRTYQAEWSYNLGIKGFSWDKSNGGKSPNDAALIVATNWDRYATSDKDLAGVMLQSQ